MKIVDDTLLAELLKKAAAAPRRRTNYNLHDSTEEPTNRLLNAMQPDTVIAPHRTSGSSSPCSPAGSASIYTTTKAA